MHGRTLRAWSLSIVALTAMGLGREATAQSEHLESKDLYRLQSVMEVEMSPDGKYIAYSISAGIWAAGYHPGGPNSELWIVDVASGQSNRLSEEQTLATHPRWSPDGKWITYWLGGTGRTEEKSVYEPVVEHELLRDRGARLMLAHADGGQKTLLATTCLGA